jgi:hypothetical protein
MLRIPAAILLQEQQYSPSLGVTSFLRKFLPDLVYCRKNIPNNKKALRSRDRISEILTIILFVIKLIQAGRKTKRFFIILVLRYDKSKRIFLRLVLLFPRFSIIFLSLGLSGFVMCC